LNLPHVLIACSVIFYCSGIGTTAIQMCKAFGARVIVTVSAPTPAASSNLVMLTRRSAKIQKSKRALTVARILSSSTLADCFTAELLGFICFCCRTQDWVEEALIFTDRKGCNVILDMVMLPCVVR
jgi:hypothetical protein